MVEAVGTADDGTSVINMTANTPTLKNSLVMVFSLVSVDIDIANSLEMKSLQIEKVSCQ